MHLNEGFRAFYGKGIQYRPFTPLDRERLTPRVPAFLLDLWQEDGWASYRDGLIWMVDPQDFDPLITSWKIPADSNVPGAQLSAVVHSALGGVLATQPAIAPLGNHVDEVIELDVIGMTYTTVAGNAERYFNRVMAKDRYCTLNLWEAEARQASAAQGALEWNQMYAHEPAYALGGSGAPETLRRVNLFAHHAMMSQVTEMKRQLL